VLAVFFICDVLTASKAAEIFFQFREIVCASGVSGDLFCNTWY